MRKLIDILLYIPKLLCYALIYFYKLCISPLLPNTCIYYPTCSTYTLQAIERFGIFKGIFIGAKRILRCTPKFTGGYDPLPPNLKGENKWLF